MTLVEAIKTGKPHKRKSDNFVFFVPQVGGIAYSQADVLAEDWETLPKPKPDLSNVTKIKKARKPRKEKK
jgi:hypothetical protein